MSLQKRQRKDEGGVGDCIQRKTLSIVPNIYKDMTSDSRFHPSQEQREAPTNKIKSTRFSLLTFIPIALFLQYKKVVVSVFTFNVCLQSVPAISTNNPLATGVPLLFIILLGMLKELYLEVKRWNDDKRINSQSVQLLRLVKGE